MYRNSATTPLLVYWPEFQDILGLGKPIPEFQAILDFAAAKDEGDGTDVAVALNMCMSPPPPIYKHSFFICWMPILMPNQQHRSTIGKFNNNNNN